MSFKEKLSVRIPNCLRYAAVACMAVLTLSAAEHRGQVKFNGLPLPGATVTATQGDKKLTAVTDGAGIYSFPDLADGVWDMQVEMLCFETQKREVAIGPETPPGEWDMKMLAFDQIKASAPAAAAPPPAAAQQTTATASAPAKPEPGAPAASTASAAAPAANPAGKSNGKGKNGKNGTAANAQSGFQRTDVNASAGSPPAPPSDAAPASMGADASAGASEAMVVNGSTSNGVERRAFGNGRRGPGSMYRGDVYVFESNSDLNARPYSLTGIQPLQPVSNNATFGGSFAGPLYIPHVLRNNGQFFLQYQGTRSRNESTANSVFPTEAERQGDFSQTLYSAGHPVTIYDPLSGAPFPNNMIPTTRINPQALSLLQYYPLPNIISPLQYNFQAPVVTRSDVDGFNARLSRSLNTKNFLSGLIGYQNSRTLTPNQSGFSFVDSGSTAGLRANAQYRHNFSRTLWGTFTEDYTRASAHTDPFFANRVDVSGNAGISGNDQSPSYWGPPSLGFSQSGITGLSDSNPSLFRRQTNAVGFNFQWARRPHTLYFVGDLRQLQFNYLSQTNPRGGLLFNGYDTGTTLNGTPLTSSGYDFADFLLGTPDSASLAFGNADKYFREGVYDLGVDDDWRVTSSLSLRLGVRWEYFAPFYEKYGRLVNLDVLPGFGNAAPVVANDPIGSLTGTHYPSSLLNPDKHAIQPRVGLSWRPFLGSSLLVKAGYGLNYNTSVYQAIASQMMQQSPLSTEIQAVNSAATPLTLAHPFNQTPGLLPNTFGIDPDFRIGYVQSWQIAVQEDIPWSMVLTTTYLGIKGTRGAQEFYPNTYPIGAANPCPSCPSGYLYETSNGNSTFEALKVAAHRRFHNGFTGDVMYTFSKAIDDAALGGAGSSAGSGAGASVIAQNWLNLAAERALSPFDQRHLLSVSMSYSTGVGVHGGGLMSGWRGVIFKGWTITDSISLGSGLPETPTYPGIIPGTNQSGLRPNYTGAGVYDATGGRFLNASAFAVPVGGTWGDVGRDTITGPGQFSLNATMARTFANNLDLTLITNNALNHLVYSSYYTGITSPLFGAPLGVNSARSVQLRLRWRF